MFRKIFNFLIIAFLLISFNLGATCIPSPTDENQEDVTLTMWGLFDSEEVWKPIIEAYTASRPYLKINYVKKDYSEYELNTSEALAAGEGPDIWMIRNDWMPRHWKKLVPMTDGLMATGDKGDAENYAESFAPVAAEDNIIDNKIYGIPLSIDTLAVYYNKEILSEKSKQLYSEKRGDEAKLLEKSPANWDDFIAMVKLLTERDGNNINKSAVALGTGNNIDVSQDILYALMLQNGTPMASADRLSATFNLTVPKSTGDLVYPGTNALNFYLNFAKPDKEVYTWNEGMPNSVDAFMDGKVAAMIHYSYIQKRFIQEKPTLNYKVGPLPQIKGTTNPIDYASYWTETVTKNSKHADEAWKFIIYCATDGNDKYASATARPNPYSVSNAAVPTDTEMRSTWASSAFEFQKMTAKDWYKGTRADKTDTIMLDMINNTYKGQPPQSAIDTAAANVTSLLRLDPNPIMPYNVPAPQQINETDGDQENNQPK